MQGIELLARLKGCMALAILVGTLFLFGGVPSAVAVNNHVFDPLLSLTGDCSTSSLDLIADPGCPDPPHPGAFARPRAVATDFYGNIYVASIGKDPLGSEGRIDVFDSDGSFITQVLDSSGPMTIAIDSKGTLYVNNLLQGKKLVRYIPSLYSPAAGEIAYENAPVSVVTNDPAEVISLEINATNDHLFAHHGSHIVEYASAPDGNTVVEDPVGEVSDAQGRALAIDVAHGRIYAGNAGNVINVFKLAPPHELLDTIEDSAVPAGKFIGPLTIAVDEGTGHLFIYDQEANKVYELSENGEYESTIEHGFQFIRGSQVGVDNGPFSPNGALNETGRYVFVPSHPNGVGHSFAFGPSSTCPPSIESVSLGGVTEDEAELQGMIDPCGLETTYTFEIVGGSVVENGQLAASKGGIQLSAAVDGLAPGTEYRFRVVAANDEGSDEEERRFSTYPSDPLAPCPNDAFRTGFSALLSDCRAYELVTPPDTNARSPRIGQLGTYFTTRVTSPLGDKVSFQIEGGSIPGTQATGSLAGDPYLATRGLAGWSTSYTGPTADESPELLPGSTSPDQAFSFWSTAGGSGTAAVEGDETSYIRYPDGHSELVGRGSLGTDPRAVGRLISDGGGHIVFVTGSTSGTTAVQLEPNAPPDGTRAIYDRTSDEFTHVVSLLPGDDTPKAGEDAIYEGASLDGRGIAFSIGGTLYLRYENTETFKIGEGVTFAGVAEGGRVFYVKAGQLQRFDAESGSITPFNSSGTVTPVNISSDGSVAYFISPNVITKAANPNGAKAAAAAQNLYLSEEGAISFVGTVTKRDVEGEFTGGKWIDGLGLWTEAVSSAAGAPGSLARVPARTTPDGGVLLFQSRSALAGYDPEGHTQVYRYDSVAETLRCLSCNPTGAAATGEASLQSLGLLLGDPEPLSLYAPVPNLRADGRRAFFQSTEALVPGDTDELQDVYEWEDQGVGSCSRTGGCIYLITSGHSSRNDYLYGVSDSGDDVFFRTSDLLLPLDSDETPSIYDARVGGGFPSPQSGSCEGEACHLPLPPAPGLSTPQTSPPGSAQIPRRCRKGQRKVKRQGKIRCVTKHRRHRSQKTRSRRAAAK